MKYNENEIIHVNKSVWGSDIEKLIAEWSEYALSPLCADYRDAMDRLKELTAMLAAVKSDTFTRKMFDRIRFNY